MLMFGKRWVYRITRMVIASLLTLKDNKMDDLKMQHGTVKWFNDQKGYGFIESGNKDYFVHFKEIKKDGFKSLAQGEQVRFTASNSPKGLTAKDVYPD